MINICKGCKKPKFIVNKKRFLCDDCNCIRLHGKSRLELTIQNSKPISRSSIKIASGTSKSNREIEIKKTLKLLKESIHKDNQNHNTYNCQGCGISGYTVHLDCSHILSVKQRKDLELIKDNIQLLCRNCHNDWESWEIKKMLNLHCFKSNLDYLKYNDQIRYNKLLIKIEENGKSTI